MSPRVRSIIDFNTVDALYALKEQKRVGWEIRGIRDPESVSDHSWGTALLCLLYARAAGVNAERAVAMALVHDIAEAVTGDVASRVDHRDRTISQRQKQLNELAAMERLFPEPDAEPGSAADSATDGGSAADTTACADAATVRSLWNEYESSTSEVARFVRDMNLVDMCLQALRYEREQRYSRAADYPSSGGFRRLDEFFATAAPRVATAVGRELFDLAHAAYRRLT